MLHVRPLQQGVTLQPVALRGRHPGIFVGVGGGGAVGPGKVTVFSRVPGGQPGMGMGVGVRVGVGGIGVGGTGQGGLPTQNAPFNPQLRSGLISY